MNTEYSTTNGYCGGDDTLTCANRGGLCQGKQGLQGPAAPWKGKALLPCAALGVIGQVAEPAATYPARQTAAGMRK